jgi:hypothetical protein
MSSDNVRSPETTPELSVSLWSLRHRLEQDADAALSLLSEWGVSNVEVPGSFAFRAQDFQKLLLRHGMKACGIIAPPIRRARSSLSFYQEWARSYLDIYSTDTIVLQSLPEIFGGGDDATNAILALLLGLADTLRAQNVKLSYHCFPHDFISRRGLSVIEHLRHTPDAPDNLGLQLDTYWLRIAKAAPSLYSGHLVHSVHLNERDAEGRCRVLGSNPDVCVKYVRPLVERQSPIKWILENDAASAQLQNGDSWMIDTLRQCVARWDAFWKEMAQLPLPDGVTAEPASDLSLSNDSPLEFREETAPDAHVYEAELNQVLTEYLFGDRQDLDELPPDEPRVRYYVEKRVSPYEGVRADSLHTPRFFHSKIWPGALPGKQLIHLVGGAGAGKSTFVRYFFQYFLPNYEIVANGAVPGSDIDRLHRSALGRHVFLYADLRRGLSAIWETLGGGLARFAQRNRIPLQRAVRQHFSEEWLRANLFQLSREASGGERRWYISWILDNTDQMSELEQRDLVRSVFRWIPEEPSDVVPSEPVSGTAQRGLWRIVIPIRPETLLALGPWWHPLRNRELVTLDPIDHDELVEKRAEFLRNVIVASNKTPFVDVCEVGVLASERLIDDRPRFDMVVPIEKAPELSESLRIAHGAQSDATDGTGIPDVVRPMFDKLVSDSARRRLYLVRMVFSSPVFHERRRLKQLSPFYFVESLIRGAKDVFDPGDTQNVVPNLYALGSDSAKSDPYSMFVGIHAVCLLSQSVEWSNSRESLRRLGYPDVHINACEKWLKNKYVLREVVSGEWSGDFTIAAGLWELLRQPAYTDNMAVACAALWGMPQKAVATNPLRPESLVTRLGGSAWFLNRMWEAEKALSVYRADDRDFAARCGPFTTFAKSRKEEKLPSPSITHLVASSYLARMEGLPAWHKPKEVLIRDLALWTRTTDEVRGVVADSGRLGALQPRQAH